MARPRRAGRWGDLWLCAGAATALLAGPAAAAEPQVVNVTSLGADRKLPLGSSFTLQGTPEEHATEVRGVFVRTSYPFWGVASFGTETNCAKVAEKLRDLRDDEPPELGEMKSSKIWLGDHDHDVLRLGTWFRENAKDKSTYTLVVPESAFFRPGATYCLFLYDGITKPLDMKALGKGLAKLEAEWGACESNVDPPACQAAVGGIDRLKAAVLGKEPAKTAPARGTPPDPAVFLSAGDYQKGQDAFASLVSKHLDVSAAGKEVRSLLQNHVPGAYRSPPAVQGAGGAPLEYMDASADPFARFFLPALARQGEIYPSDPVAASAGALPCSDAAAAAAPPKDAPAKGAPAKGAPAKGAPAKGAPAKGGNGGQAAKPEPQYRLADGEAIRCLAVSPEDKVLVAPGRPSETNKPKAVTTKLSDVMLPGGKISVLDLIEYERGRLRFDGKTYAPIGQVYTKVVKPVLESPLTADTAGLEVLRQHLGELSATFRRALGLDKPTGTPAALTGSEIVHARMGEWLKERVLSVGDCRKPVPGILDPAQQPPCDAGGWPGYDAFSDSPLGRLTDELDKTSAGLEAIREARKEMEKLRQIRKLKSLDPIPTKIAMTRETWVFHFVVPSVGFGAALGAQSPFGFQYGGVKIYGFPNPADEPMWTNGRADIWRFFALELGLGTTPGNFGPQERFTGIADGKLPALLLGLAIQPAPYVTGSVGAMFMNRRRSTLVEEKLELFVSPYLAVGIDFNVFDGIAGLVGKARSARVDAPPSK